MPPLSRFRPARSTILGLLLLFALALPLAAKPAAWIKLQAGEFTIYSDAAEKPVIDCALRYAAFRRAFAELFLPLGQPLPPSTLVLFKENKSFRAITPASDSPNRTMKTVNFSCEVDGMALTTFALAGDRDRALALTFEFETIWALRRLGHFVPQWMIQGAGEVLATVNVEKGQCLIGEQDERGFNDQFDWPRFFDASADSKFYREATSELSDYLDQAWGLMHWILLSDTGTRERFDAIEQALRTRPALDVIPEQMQTPIAQLSKTIRRHPKTPRKIPFDEATVRATFRVSPAPEAEVLVETANILAATQRTAEADAQIERARALGPDLALVREALARRCLREGRPRDAIDFYRAAIAAGSDNFVAYLYSATQRLDDNRTNGSDLPGEGGPESVQACVELRRALALNPGSLDLYQRLGRALYVSPQLAPEDLAALAPGLRSGPEGQTVRFYRALLHGRLGHRAELVEDFRAIIADPTVSEKLRESARRQYLAETVGADSRRIEKLVHQLDYAAACDILEAGEKDDAPAVRAAYAKVRDWLKKTVARDSAATPEERRRVGLD